MTDIFEQHDATILALLLEFNKEIKERYQIPSPFKIENILKELPEKVKSRLHQRVREGLWKITRRGVAGPEESENYLEGFMFAEGYVDKILEGTWKQSFGDLFRFRDKKRQDIEERVKTYWTDEEQQDFHDIGKILRKKIEEYYTSR